MYLLATQITTICSKILKNLFYKTINSKKLHPYIDQYHATPTAQIEKNDKVSLDPVPDHFLENPQKLAPKIK